METEKDVFVYVDLDSVPHLVGRLRARVRVVWRAGSVISPLR